MKSVVLAVLDFASSDTAIERGVFPEVEMCRLTLRVVQGADRGRIYSELKTPISIGREEGNTIQLNDERISRFHCKIQEDNDHLVLTDLESTNGHV